MVCGGVLAAIAALRFQRNSTPNLLARLPVDDAVVVYIDFEALRRAHVLDILAGSNVVQEPEYRAFVDQTGFDYLRDLDTAFVSFHPDGTYFLLRGRFDWRNLTEYTVGQGGACHNTLCKVQGSTPERKISYFPLQPNVMALAVSKSDSAVLVLQGRGQALKFELPNEPVWSLVPVSALKNASDLPAGPRMFARALTGADRILLTLGPEGGRMELRLDVTCRSADDAKSLAAQLTDATARLRELIARQKQAPNPRDLSGILTAGAFDQKDVHVLGRWPIERAFLEALAGSAI